MDEDYLEKLRLGKRDNLYPSESNPTHSEPQPEQPLDFN
jgi:hypothetical protein